MNPRLLSLCATVFISCLTVSRPGFADTPAVEVIRAPDGGVQPQACVDGEGTVHLVYGKTGPKGAWGPGDLFYVRMKAGEKGFSAPIRVNSQPGSAMVTGTVGGAQIAIGRGGRVHVVWNSPNVPKGKGAGGGEGGKARDGQPEGGEKKNEHKPLFYARMNDAGTGFLSQRDVGGKTEVLEGAGTVAADERGNVYVLWTSRGPVVGEGNRAVYMAHSPDDGKTFEAESIVNPRVTGACLCCSMRAAVDVQGRLYATYRAAGETVHRDSTLLYASQPGGPLQDVKLDEWAVQYCPASSYGLAPTGSGALVAWESKGQIYFAAFDAKSGKLGDPIAVAGEAGRRKYPVIVANTRGQKLLAWAEGVSWASGGSAAWQVYGEDYKPIGTKGEAPGVPPSCGVSAFARPDGGFVVVY